MSPVLQAIDNMTSAEKIQTMDYLWTALEASSNDYTPPAWHARELARRRALYEAGKVPVYDWTAAPADTRSGSLLDPILPESRHERNQHRQRAKDIGRSHQNEADLKAPDAISLGKRTHQDPGKASDEKGEHREYADGRRTVLRRDDVEKRGVRVHLEESPEDAVRGRQRNHRRRRAGDPDQREARCAAEEREDLESKAEARHPLHEPIRKDSAGDDRHKRKKMVPQHRLRTRRSD